MQVDESRSEDAHRIYLDRKGVRQLRNEKEGTTREILKNALLGAKETSLLHAGATKIYRRIYTKRTAVFLAFLLSAPLVWR